jgi:hypothetical protein
MLLGDADLPHPEADYLGFERAAAQALSKVPHVYDPIRKRNAPWVDLSRLKRKYDPAHCGCVIA